ncbi:MAG: DNA mismatch repair endonuclease MutL [Candidatus Omnitrophota bacterium]
MAKMEPDRQTGGPAKIPDKGQHPPQPRHLATSLSAGPRPGRIKILPENIVQKIAAGEVIERPASVVKELVENSLDAASTEISIEILKAGKSLIRITDDGLGIDAEDIPHCIKRHATSKIKDIEDLERISTFGFRGEALSAIAAVSFLKIISKTKNADAATVLSQSGGGNIVLQKTAARQGTNIEINRLFFNTPARLKFLKSDATELTHIINIVSALALAEENVGFKLYSGKKELINTPPNQKRKERIKDLSGTMISEHLLDISTESDNFSIKGFISRPEAALANRGNQYIFINKRPVTSRSLSHAIYSAYEKFIGRDKFPAVFIFIKIAPQLVDVNVHPTKREVRFYNEKVLHDTLFQEIEQKLLQAGAEEITPFSRQIVQDFTPGVPNIHSVNTPPPTQMQFENFIADDFLIRKVPEALPGRPYVRQINKMYILSEEKNALVIYDQHAAHERILYERLLKKNQFPEAEKQMLLMPVSLEITAAQKAQLKENLEMFSKIGFDIEEIGADVFAVCSCPPFIEHLQVKEIIIAMLSEFEYTDFPRDLTQKYEKVVSTCACHAAIKANQELTGDEMLQMLADLKTCENPAYCPHGRPTFIQITYEQMLKNFKRT